MSNNNLLVKIVENLVGGICVVFTLMIYLAVLLTCTPGGWLIILLIFLMHFI